MIKTSSNAWLLKPEAIAKHDRGGGAATTPLVTKGLGATGFITGFTEFKGGAKIPFHYHNCEETVMLIEGHAWFDIDGESFEVKPQDVTFIPAGVPHRFRNASETQSMKILWVYGSVDANRTLVETGETRPIAAEHAS
ncbi:cupin domain-containing protein [Pseudomonas sp. DC3000-4b1]|uniref:cupin domain-containing protein n=1 Tax=unclassified Pseudomonas TaxID=196821 RepID=UPI003CF74339